MSIHRHMITRTHIKDDAPSTALYSDCERYRYSLTRTWDAAGPRLLYIMLNPSKATEVQNDPTVERCERRARTLGFGAFRVTNIFGWRETEPKLMRAAIDPVGPENDAVLEESLNKWIRQGDMTLGAWGAHGDHMDQGHKVAALLRDSGRVIHALGVTKHGHPRHPLYVAYAQPPQVWDIP